MILTRAVLALALAVALPAVSAIPQADATPTPSSSFAESTPQSSVLSSPISSSAFPSSSSVPEPAFTPFVVGPFTIQIPFVTVTVTQFIFDCVPTPGVPFPTPSGDVSGSGTIESTPVSSAAPTSSALG